jgi:hypothetical protein
MAAFNPAPMGLEQINNDEQRVTAGVLSQLDIALYGEGELRLPRPKASRYQRQPIDYNVECGEWRSVFPLFRLTGTAIANPVSSDALLASPSSPSAAAAASSSPATRGDGASPLSAHVMTSPFGNGGGDGGGGGDNEGQGGMNSPFFSMGGRDGDEEDNMLARHGDHVDVDGGDDDDDFDSALTRCSSAADTATRSTLGGHRASVISPVLFANLSSPQQQHQQQHQQQQQQQQRPVSAGVGAADAHAAWQTLTLVGAPLLKSTNAAGGGGGVEFSGSHASASVSVSVASIDDAGNGVVLPAEAHEVVEEIICAHGVCAECT